MSTILHLLELWMYPTIALVIFLAVFAGIVYRVMRGGKRLEQHGAIPFEDGTTPRAEDLA